jgi:UDP-glucose 4-epimerase
MISPPGVGDDHLAERLADSARADASRVQRELSFRPTRSDLQTVIESAWRWHQFAHSARA